jgi:hypothetical protein
MSLLLLQTFVATAQAYGPIGHIIAGLAAEPLLCASARREIDTLSDGASLADLGLWADRIRGDERWRQAAPWHYVNIPDGVRPAAFVHPPEGDVIEAIGRFSVTLVDTRRPHAERLDALRFLVHFIVDVHQPLHVGRADDRGGNTIDVHYETETVNLHAFWDTDAIALASMKARAYAAHIAPRVAQFAAVDTRSRVLEWAEESMRLRRDVYDFDAVSGQLSPAYLGRARAITEDRLVQAAARLANALNAAWCR